MEELSSFFLVFSLMRVACLMILCPKLIRSDSNLSVKKIVIYFGKFKVTLSINFDYTASI